MKKFRLKLLLITLKANFKFSLLTIISVFFACFFSLILATQILHFFNNFSQMKLIDSEKLLVYESGNANSKFLEEVALDGNFSIVYSMMNYLPDENKLVQLTGVDEQIKNILPLKITQGKFIREGSNVREVILPDGSEAFFRTEIGDNIQIADYNYRVVGFQKSYYFANSILISSEDFLKDFSFKSFTAYFDVANSQKVSDFVLASQLDESSSSLTNGNEKQKFIVQHELLFVGITFLLTFFFFFLSLGNCILSARGLFQKEKNEIGIKIACGLLPRQYLMDKFIEMLAILVVSFVLAVIFAIFGQNLQLAEFSIQLSIGVIILGFVISLIIPFVLYDCHKRWLKK